MTENKNEGGTSILLYGAIALLVAILAFNQIQISSISGKLVSSPILAASGPVAVQSGSVDVQAIADKILPKGVPPIYGSELGVSFDDPVAGLPILAKLDDATKLDDAQTKRYTKITLQISCEYCCGAESIVFPNGQAACGCQHSFAMRGLAKYLVTKHGSEYTDDQILEELGKLKTLYFPKQIITKALAFASAGMDSNINIIDLTSNRFRDFKAPATSSGSAAGALANAPDMVGGC